MFIYIVLSCALLGHVFSQTGLSSADKKDILDEHNKLRSEVKPSAANMERMSWSDELARVAQNYANLCKFAHNFDRNKQQRTFRYVGENWYAQTGGPNYEVGYVGAVRKWHSEVDDYDYDRNRCSNRVCGHYTQVVWSNSNAIGCGAKRCPGGNGGWLFLVCDYGPGGNYSGQKPYEAGESCSKCPSDKPNCSEKLCQRTSSKFLTAVI